MPIDPRKRQKKLERRKVKQKAERRQLARRESQGMSARLEQACKAPILHCCTTTDIWEHGMGDVLVSRELSNGNVAFVMFLVDMFCLGVKDVIMKVAPRGLYQRDIYDKLAARSELVRLKPECARKLVEGAVQFALELELPRHRDYRTAKLIFGDISAEACSEQFVYGKNGKHLFIAGPNDSAAKCDEIFRKLEEHHEGPQGHHFLAGPTAAEVSADKLQFPPGDS